MNYREALGWLFSTQRFGIKLGLDNVRRLLTALAVPPPEQGIIHVAGTNGKGSVCAMIDSILRAQGYRTGLFTSPHLVTFRERIQVDGEMISQAAVADGLTQIWGLTSGWEPHPTFFEITTALGLLHFRNERCEIVVLETGMGGRLDASNAVSPVVSVITPIALDHQKWLGETLGEIAREKAGIIKPGVPIVAAAQPPEAEIVIRNRAAELGAKLEIIPEPWNASAVRLSGVHQRENAALAVAAVNAAAITIEQRAIDDGLASVNWPARFQRWSDTIVIDGSHNPAGARALVDTWRDVFGAERGTVILAVLADKNVASIAEALTPIAVSFLLPQIRAVRACSPNELACAISDIAPEIPVEIMPSFSAALEKANAAGRRILITGSLHFAGEALALLRGDADAVEDCLQ